MILRINFTGDHTSLLIYTHTRLRMCRCEGLCCLTLHTQVTGCTLHCKLRIICTPKISGRVFWNDQRIMYSALHIETDTCIFGHFGQTNSEITQCFARSHTNSRGEVNSFWLQRCCNALMLFHFFTPEIVEKNQPKQFFKGSVFIHTT